MENKIFWALFAIALIAGLALGTFVNTSFVVKGTSFTDDDGGRIYDKVSICRDGSGSHRDVCENRKILREWWYGKDGCQSVEFDCINAGYAGGCYDGACQKEQRVV